MVDIIIVNWNSGDYLEKCINSIFSVNNRTYVKNIFIIDNNSKDSSLERIKLHDKIQIIQNKENLGFARASNQGFKLSRAPYILLLNPDTQLLDSTLEDCISFMEKNQYEKNQYIDILGCRLLNDKGEVTPSCARFPTPGKLFVDSIGLSKILPSVFNPAILMTDWDHKTSRFVDQVMGAFMFMRESVFEKIGFFDERFFVYFEDLDFSKRLSTTGGKSFFNADISAIHSGKGTTETVKPFRLFLNLRSRLQYANKHFTVSGYSLVWLGTYFIEPISRVSYLFFRGKFSEIKSVLKGYKMLLNKTKKISDTKFVMK
jgi:GT2 family glycosyltransferase